MEKIFVVKGVAEKLWAAEAAIDETLDQATALISSITEARRELEISHIIVDPAISKVAESVAALAQARRAMIEAHHALNEVKLRLGVRTKMDGGHWSVDADHEPKQSSAELRSVG